MMVSSSPKSTPSPIVRRGHVAVGVGCTTRYLLRVRYLFNVADILLAVVGGLGRVVGVSVLRHNGIGSGE